MYDYMKALQEAFRPISSIGALGYAQVESAQ